MLTTNKAASSVYAVGSTLLSVSMRVSDQLMQMMYSTQACGLCECAGRSPSGMCVEKKSKAQAREVKEIRTEQIGKERN